MDDKCKNDTTRTSKITGFMYSLLIQLSVNPIDRWCSPACSNMPTGLRNARCTPQFGQSVFDARGSICQTRAVNDNPNSVTNNSVIGKLSWPFRQTVLFSLEYYRASFRWMYAVMSELQMSTLLVTNACTMAFVATGVTQCLIIELVPR